MPRGAARRPRRSCPRRGSSRSRGRRGARRRRRRPAWRTRRGRGRAGPNRTGCRSRRRRCPGSRSAQLRLEVALERGVAVEVVGREVEDRRRTRGRRPRVSSSWKLEHSQTMVASGGDLADEGRQRRPDVAGHGDRLAGRPPEVSEELGHRRLPVGPGDGDETVREQPPGELELADDRRFRARGPRRSTGASAGTPGALDHASRAVERVQLRHHPGSLRRRGASSPSAPSGEPESTPITSSPRAARSRAAAWPDRARPTTR